LRAQRSNPSFAEGARKTWIASPRSQRRHKSGAKRPESRPSFFEKKEAKKLLQIDPEAMKPPRPKLTKVFWFFFSKKNFFLT
jgi:hypothetical protein